MADNAIGTVTLPDCPLGDYRSLLAGGTADLGDSVPYYAYNAPMSAIATPFATRDSKMQLKLNPDKFDELQAIFIGELVDKVRIKLEEAGLKGLEKECRRARDTFWDIQVPK